MKKKLTIISVLVLVGCMAVLGDIYLGPYFKPFVITGVFVPYRYKIYDDQVEIVEYLGEEEEVVIPERLYGHDVTVIGQSSFNKKQNLTSVIIPDSVEIIDNGAFFACKKLEQIKFPARLKSIGIVAFSHCESLKEIDFPEGIEIIGECSFSMCKSLEKIDIPGSVLEIRDGAFYECVNLVEVNIPASVPQIAERAFSDTPWMEAQTGQQGIMH